MQNSKIEWTHHTWNPWIGCTKVSPGCAHCYAATLMDTRYGRVKWGFGNPRVRTSSAYWRQPYSWNRRAALSGVRERVFCASLADVFDPEVPPTWREDMWNTIQTTPSLDWLLLTKRTDKMESEVARLGLPNNVWLGVSVEDQKRAEIRIPAMRRLPATVRFLSVEPLLDQVDLSPWLDAIDWVIVGGESGPGARMMNPAWLRLLRDQCITGGIPFFFKQWGGVQKHATGHELDGRTWQELPPSAPRDANNRRICDFAEQAC